MILLNATDGKLLVIPKTTTTCQKRRDEASKCANCKGNHISSYKGCPSYKDTRNKLLISRQMHHAKTHNLHNQHQYTQQHQQAARQHKMPSPPAPGGQPTSSMQATASAPAANDRPSYSQVLRSPVLETAPLSPAPGRLNRHQQPVQHHLQKNTISNVKILPANKTQQPFELQQHQQYQHRRQLADEQTQRRSPQQQSSKQPYEVSNGELLLALQRSVEINV